jgi:hypothetical protein
MDDSANLLDDQDVEWVIQLAHASSPAATAVVVKADTFAFIEGPTEPLRNLPWSTHDCGVAKTLLELFDAGSQAEVSAAMSRAHLASIGTTTVRSLAGQPVQLVLHTFGPESA